MDNWIFIIVITVAISVSAVILVILLYRRKMRRILDSLDNMLDRAIDGDFTEYSLDESALSAVEAKMDRFLSSSSVSSKNLAAEKENIKILISDISHQTKTPIANIILYAQLLGEGDLPEDCEVYVKILSEQAKKLDFLISALVKISRLESGIITVQPQKGNLQELLENAITQISPKAEAKEIDIQAKSTDGIAYFDPKWTVEAIYNVLDNAVKYSPSHSIIKVSVIPYEIFFRIDITDQAMGIKEDEQSKIFTRFYRSPMVGTKEGVGIGLFISREILSAGGGYIKVASKPEHGSTFSIFLPRDSR